MTLRESSGNPGAELPTTPDFDMHLPDNRPADGTAAAATNKQDGDETRPFLTYKDGMARVSNGAHDIIHLGIDPDLGEGLFFLQENGSPLLALTDDFLKIANPGGNALTDSDDDLAYNSKRRIFKILATGVVDLGTDTPAGAGNSVFIPHGQASNPLVVAFATVTDVTNGTRTVPLPHYTIGTTSGISSSVRVITAYVTMFAGSVSIVFNLRGNAIDTSATVRYYIIEATAV